MSDVIEQSTATEQTGSPVDVIAGMIAANRRNNSPENSTPPPAGQETKVSPEATPTKEVEPEDGTTETVESVEHGESEESSEGVNEPLNFVEFAKSNPDIKLRIPNKDADGGFIELTAEKAASILGQGSAIHESARKLKVERADFEEYEAKRKNELDGLQIGLELTVVPQLQGVAEELITLQQYNQQWQQILAGAQTVEQRSEAEAAIRQNSKLITEKSQFIQANRPKIEQFYQHRAQVTQQELEKARQGFTDKDLANKANFTELRDKLARDWKGAKGSFVPGVQNIDLVSSDEYILGLIRDGMKFRDGPVVKNAGGSLAAAGKITSRVKTSPDSKVEELQKKASSGDKNATRDLLATFLTQNKRKR